MKQSILSLGLLVMFGFTAVSQNRYFSEIFSTVSVSTDVVYGNNITVLTGSPVAEDLLMDVYTPDGDTVSARPVVIVVHSGDFLPVPINQGCIGGKSDEQVVALCTRLAKYGYVAAAIDMRSGWNPVSSDQEVRTGTYLNALYRATQDVRNAVRYFRWSADNSNTYAVNPNRISVIGEGTGAEVAMWVGALDRSEELELSKFINPITLGSYVDSTLSGNVYGTNTKPLNIANYPSYGSEISFVGSLGGAVGDSTWIEAGEPPVVSMHGMNDPFVPYGFGAIIVSTTGDFLINVSGSRDVQRKSNQLGNNDVYLSAMLNDPVTQLANSMNEGYSGLYPFVRPTPENGPWQWWDATSCPNNTQALQTNPDMSETKGQLYIDTIMAYMAPRMAIANGFWNSGVGIREAAFVGFHVFPNPTENMMFWNGINAQTAKVMDNTGRVVMNVSQPNGSIDISALTEGIYLLSLETKDGTYTSRVVKK